MGMPSGAYSSSQARKENIPEGYEQFAINNYTPEQERVFKQTESLIRPDSFMARLAAGDSGEFAAMEAPALRQFNEMQGGLASRFSGIGMGGRNSSGFQNTMTSASQDFASQLQAKRLELRNKAISDMMGMSSQFLNFKPQEKGLVQKPPVEKKQWGSMIGTGLGAVVGGVYGGPAGAMVGSSIGGAAGGLFD
jgi:hypothetical protein